MNGRVPLGFATAYPDAARLPIFYEIYKAHARAWKKEHYKNPVNRERSRARCAAYAKANREKLRLYYRNKYAENPEIARGYARKYRLVHPDYWQKYSQKYLGLPVPTRPMPEVCECCGGPPGKQALHNDHCHDTGKFRGWLCGKCNKAIGLLGDNEAGVVNAIVYLRK